MNGSSFHMTFEENFPFAIKPYLLGGSEPHTYRMSDQAELAPHPLALLCHSFYFEGQLHKTAPNELYSQLSLDHMYDGKKYISDSTFVSNKIFNPTTVNLISASVFLRN